VHRELLGILSGLQTSESQVRSLFAQLDGRMYTAQDALIPGSPFNDGPVTDHDADGALELTPETSAAYTNGDMSSATVDIVDIPRLRTMVDTATRHISGRYQDVSMDHFRSMVQSLLGDVDISSVEDSTKEGTVDLIKFRASPADLDSIYGRNVAMVKRMCRMVTEDSPLIREVKPPPPSSSLLQPVAALRDTLDSVVDDALVRSGKYAMKDDDFDRLTDLMIALCEVDDDQATALAYRADEKGCGAFPFAVGLYCYLSSCVYKGSQQDEVLEAMVAVPIAVHWLHQYFVAPADADDVSLTVAMEHTCSFWGVEIPVVFRSFIHGCAYGSCD
jgi:hypothetical protein